MQFIQSKNQSEGAGKLAKEIASRLNNGEKVLWFVCGGSNIPISVEVMGIIRATVSLNKLANLTVTLTDERFGLVGHKDSNWFQLGQAGFDFSGIGTLPILKLSFNVDLDKTVTDYSRTITEEMHNSDFTIAQFGIGADGHIAGILPNSPAVNSAQMVTAYDAPPFTRITLTFPILRKIDAAYAFVFGDSKKTAIERLKKGGESLRELPSLILNEIKEAVVYTDQ